MKPATQPYASHTRAIRKPYGVFALVSGMFFATCVAAQDIPVPSGQPISFLEFISENDGDLVRFRFLAPDIGEGLPYDVAFPDFQVLCDEQVMPALAANDLTPTQIVLSMSAVDIPFGEDNADVLQFFEIFRPENDACIWEEF